MHSISIYKEKEINIQLEGKNKREVESNLGKWGASLVYLSCAFLLIVTRIESVPLTKYTLHCLLGKLLVKYFEEVPGIYYWQLELVCKQLSSLVEES